MGRTREGECRGCRTREGPLPSPACRTQEGVSSSGGVELGR